MERLAACIFDLDGTLVDSEPLHCRAWLEVLGHYGLQYDEHWFEQWIGHSDRILAETVIGNDGLAATVRELQDQKQGRYHELVSSANYAFPTIIEGLQQLGRSLPLAIATNSSRLDTEHVFRSTPLDRHVRTVVTADDVARLKPDPDMFLLAAERLGVDPSHCVVIEDSPAGSTAARAAGMFVLGVTSSQPAERMQAAHRLFADPPAAFTALLSMAELEQC